jgi:uncharacterized membrane protein YedE/YeeE
VSTIVAPDWLCGIAGGLMIGAAGALLLLANGRVMGASGILGGLADGTGRADAGERIAFLAALVGVPWVLWAAFGGAANLAADWTMLAVAGFLTGLGTRLAGGCTSGHGVCGLSRLSRRGIVATVCYLGAGVATVTLMRHGGLDGGLYGGLW